MRLDSVTIQGVLAFDDAHTVAFRDLPPGLIAFTGAIGRGKTTLLEAAAATIFRTFPSREKKPPFDYATRADAFLETVFELEGRGTYRARLNLDHLRRKQEAVLLRREPDGREVFVATQQSLDAYDAAIAELFPSLDQLLVSVLAVQTRRGSFSERDRKGRREVLQSMLGLDGYEAKAERARAAILRVTQAIDTETAVRDALAREAGADVEDALEQRAQALQVQIGEVEVRRATVRRRIADAERDQADVAEQARIYAAAEAAHRQHEAEITARTAERTHVQTALDRHQREGQAERRRLVERHTEWLLRNAAAQEDTAEAEAEAAAANARCDQTVAALRAKIAANQGLLDRGPAIRAAAARVGVLATQHAQEAEAAKTAALAVDAARSAEAIVRSSLTALATQEAALHRAEHDAALLDRVPCHGDAAYAQCEFLTNAQQAQRQIATLTETLAAKPPLEAESRAIADRLRDARARYETATETMAALDRERATLSAAAAELPDLLLAEDRIQTRTQQIAAAEAQRAEDLRAAALRAAAHVVRLRDERQQREEEHAGALTVYDERHTAQVDASTAQLAALDSRIAAATTARQQAATVMARTHAAADRAAAVQARLTTYRAEAEAIAGDLATVQAAHRELDALRTAVAHQRQRIADLDRRLAGLQADLVDWQALAKAYSRDGLPTLEIDAAGPRITSLFNELLHASYGSRFTGELVTQVPKLSKGRDGSTHKEVVEFKIYDHAKGSAERDLTDLSGGQKIVVEEALRSAIALYVNERLTTPMRTCWRDETTSGLDQDSALRYIAMLRRVYEIGQFHHLIFSSHNLECARLADAQIVFTAEGAFDIAYPPYAVTALADEVAVA